ncbi:alkaline phosphatase family protein [Sphingomicrobium aestuariivivum]|uniref:alkaline phosphatase family protein n=1 Tax=Sphingomicrobium aestuariivivum TaxID=1582356 RepID=UPI001FD6A95E|nr:alkaline phosphatase family protein [Sphingomicrobium aestuariivivum]MCJ8189753.1 alkaline phosphatase family protein [Sphingomicrobium aestuariivivum]
MRLTAPLLAATMMAGLSACAATPEPVASAPASDIEVPEGSPKLLVVISVDQLSSQLMTEYLPRMSGGLKRVATMGTTFVNGYQAQSATETCPGHSTILTGSFPARSGIVANDWYDFSTGGDYEVYCSEDVARRGEWGDRDVISPEHLLVPTLGTYLKRVDPRSRNIAIAGKDRSAVMLGGHDADQRWWLSEDGWSTDLDAPAPDVVTSATLTLRGMIEQGSAGLEVPEYCASKPDVVLEGRGPIGDDTLGWAPGDRMDFMMSPAQDGAVLALGAALIDDMELGRDDTPDVVSLGLAATDYIGHKYGPQSGEMCLQMFALDRNLDGFFKLLDQRGLDYAVVLTADHGGQPIPERLALQGIEAERVDGTINRRARAKVTEVLDLPENWVAGGYPGDIYINPEIEASRRGDAIARLAAAYREDRQVGAVFTRDEIMAQPIPTGNPTDWTLLQRVRATYHPARSGDLYVVATEYLTPIPNPVGTYIATHGSPYEYDRRVPIIFYRPGTSAFLRQDPARTVDILPTVAAHLGLSLGDAELDGVCLDGVHGVRCAD